MAGTKEMENQTEQKNVEQEIQKTISRLQIFVHPYGLFTRSPAPILIGLLVLVFAVAGLRFATILLLVISLLFSAGYVFLQVTSLRKLVKNMENREPNNGMLREAKKYIRISIFSSICMLFFAGVVIVKAMQYGLFIRA